MKKKILATILTTAMTMSLFAGCGVSTSSSGTSGDSGAAEADAGAADSGAADSWMNTIHLQESLPWIP